ncbi:MAG: hypothetical protein LWX70_15975 [Sphingobacteriia bacterium]|nr:hypothetical protein [Sphingobacteriia bacterium]
MVKANATSKITDLFPILETHFKGKIDRSRLKLMSIDSEALSSSSLRRIQRFIADFILDVDLIAKMIYSFLADKENLSLCSNCLTADSEFIGDTWIKYHNDREIRY